MPFFPSPLIRCGPPSADMPVFGNRGTRRREQAPLTFDTDFRKTGMVVHAREREKRKKVRWVEKAEMGCLNSPCILIATTLLCPNFAGPGDQDCI